MSKARVALTSLDHIEFGDRRREDYGELEELAQSIRDRGVIQPLAVMETGDARKPYRLLAGGRRFKAIELAELNTDIPVRVYPADLPELEVRSIELAENFHRKDLEWHEQVRLQKEIHDLQIAIHGEAKKGARTDLGAQAAGWSLGDTADLVGRSKPSVQKDVALASMLEQHPDVFAHCKNKNDAAKVMDQMKEEVIRQEMAKRAAARVAEGKSQGLADKFILKDFFQGVQSVPDESVHLVEIDPPYGMDLQNKKRGENVSLALHDYNEIPTSEYADFLTRTFTACYEKMAKHSWLICWFAHEPWFELVYQQLRAAGFKGGRMVGIWQKPNGQTKQPNIYLANTTEFFFYMRKGEPVIQKAGRSNVFSYAPVPAQKKTHPTERPMELIQDVLETFATPGMKVMVPFLGSGKTLAAAHSLGMDCHGYELTKQYKDSFLVNLHKGLFL